MTNKKFEVTIRRVIKEYAETTIEVVDANKERAMDTAIGVVNDCGFARIVWLDVSDDFPEDLEEFTVIHAKELL